jgi:hypothetical protein
VYPLTHDCPDHVGPWSSGLGRDPGPDPSLSVNDFQVLDLMKVDLINITRQESSFCWHSRNVFSADESFYEESLHSQVQEKASETLEVH